MKNTKKEADTYTLKVSNPGYGLCGPNSADISVRQVILTATGATSLNVGFSSKEKLAKRLMVEGGYTNTLTWRPLSGGSLGSLNGSTGEFTAGTSAGQVQIEASSYEDSRVSPITFTITIQP